MRALLLLVATAVVSSGCLTAEDVHCLVAECSIESTPHSGADDPTSGSDSFTDSDGDTVPDDADAFPSDASEYADLDGDGTGDNADDDDDDDGTPDEWDHHRRGDARVDIALTRLDAVDACDADDATCEFVVLFTNENGIELARWPESGSAALSVPSRRDLTETISLDVPEDRPEFVLVAQLVDDDGDGATSVVDIGPDSTRRVVWTFRLGMVGGGAGSDNATAATLWDGREDGLSEVDGVAEILVGFR